MAVSSNEAKTLIALRALENNPKLSLRKAAKIYQIPCTTLGHRRAGRTSRADTVPNNRNLTPLEEDVLIQRILDLDSQGHSPAYNGVEEMADKLLTQRDTRRVGKRWAMNFVRRHSELKTRLSRRYDYQRAKCEDPEIIRGWFALMKNFKDKLGVLDDDIYNFDKTGFLMGVISAMLLITTSKGRN